MSFGFRWTQPPSATIIPALQQYNERVLAAVRAIADYIGQKMQDESRQNAPWEDRTGNARSGLFTAVTQEASQMLVTIYLSHGSTINYGKFLELCNGGKYAIIMPTIEANLPVVEQMLRDLFR